MIFSIQPGMATVFEGPDRSPTESELRTVRRTDILVDDLNDYLVNRLSRVDSWLIASSGYLGCVFFNQTKF